MYLREENKLEDKQKNYSDYFGNYYNFIYNKK